MQNQDAMIQEDDPNLHLHQCPECLEWYQHSHENPAENHDILEIMCRNSKCPLYIDYPVQPNKY